MSDHVSAPPAVGFGPSHPTVPIDFGPLSMVVLYLPKSVRGWRRGRDTHRIPILSDGLLPKPRSYPKRSDNTVYCPLFTACPRHCHVMPTSLPCHAYFTTMSTPHQRPACHCSKLSARSPVPVDHSQTATSPFHTRPHPMTSCWRHPKNAPKPKMSIFGQKSRFFRIIRQKTFVRPACNFTTISPPACWNSLQSRGRLEVNLNKPPLLCHDQVFTEFFTHLVYSVLHW